LSRLLPSLDPFYAVLNEMYVDVLNETGLEWRHMAGAAGFTVALVATPYGLEVGQAVVTELISKSLIPLKV